MICKNSFTNFSEAYSETLKDVLKYGKKVQAVDNPLSPARHYGKKPSSSTIELLNYSFIVENPFSSLFFSPSKFISLPYAVGLFLWSLSGSDEAEWLSYYHPNVKTIFPDASHLSGAFGKRMFNYGNILNQVEKVVEKLQKHNTTRRTTIMISEPNDHLGVNIEFPCAIATQYFLRENSLHSITYMRAQSAMAVMPYDVFLFMNIHIYIAKILGVEVGSYTHNCGTIHIYEDEVEKVKEILENKVEEIILNKISINDINETKLSYKLLIESEKQLRKNLPCEIKFNIDDYFSDLMEMLNCYKFLKQNNFSNSCKFEKFYTPLFKSFM